ncbi:C39 family peptidase [Chloroflexi bacterium TSY]|nr:C39 family peptidase [Chloroflexi bacterium TSY]
MQRKNRFLSPLNLALLLITTTTLLILIAGVWRYGSPQGIVRRVQAAIAARQPHPAFVPTPLIADQRLIERLTAADSSQSESMQSVLATEISKTNQPVRVFNELLTDANQNGTPTNPTPTFNVVTSTSTLTSVLNLTPMATQTPLPTPLPKHENAKPFVELIGLNHEWQTWNNCGPATLAMNLSYFGSQLDQAAIGSVLRLYEDDKNVSPAELAAFARGQGYRAQVRVNGTRELARTLLSNNIPVLIETWLEEEPNDGMGHYRLLTGFDDARRQWIAYDSYVSTNFRNPGETYQGIHLSYDETAQLWHVFSGTYLLIYPPEQEAVVRSILGEAFDEGVMWRQALAQAQINVEQRIDDPFAWFNLGTAWIAHGEYVQAANAYDRARWIGLPWRMLWYQFGPFEAYYETGRYQEVVALANATIATTQSIEELYFWQGKGLAALGDRVGAQRAWQRALELNPNYQPAANALNGLTR